MKLSRTDIRTITGCPACGAERGQNCRRVRQHARFGYTRISNHQERVNEALRTIQR